MPIGEVPNTGFELSELSQEAAINTGGQLLVAGVVVLGGIWILREMYQGVMGKTS